MSADLPDRIRVKISSEAAGEISMSPVVTQELPIAELLDVLLGVCGSKDLARLGQLLSHGSVVQSASRFRWSPMEVDARQLAAALARFPDSDPSRKFDAKKCVGARLAAPRGKVDLPKSLAEGRRLLRRRSFWDVLMAEAAKAGPTYVEYVYRDHADLFRVSIDAAVLAEAAELLRYSGLVEQVRRASTGAVELLVTRG